MDGREGRALPAVVQLGEEQRARIRPPVGDRDLPYSRHVRALIGQLTPPVGVLLFAESRFGRFVGVQFGVV